MSQKSSCKIAAHGHRGGITLEEFLRGFAGLKDVLFSETLGQMSREPDPSQIERPRTCGECGFIWVAKNKNRSGCNHARSKRDEHGKSLYEEEDRTQVTEACEDGIKRMPQGKMSAHVIYARLHRTFLNSDYVQDFAVQAMKDIGTLDADKFEASRYDQDKALRERDTTGVNNFGIK